MCESLCFVLSARVCLSIKYLKLSVITHEHLWTPLLRSKCVFRFRAHIQNALNIYFIIFSFSLKCHACIPMKINFIRQIPPIKLKSPWITSNKLKSNKAPVLYLHECQKISQNDIEKVKFQRILICFMADIPVDIVDKKKTFWLLCKHTWKFRLRNSERFKYFPSPRSMKFNYMCAKFGFLDKKKKDSNWILGSEY